MRAGGRLWYVVVAVSAVSIGNAVAVVVIRPWRQTFGGFAVAMLVTAAVVALVRRAGASSTRSSLLSVGRSRPRARRHRLAQPGAVQVRR